MGRREQRPMADLDLAIAFVTRHGDAVEQARLRHLLTGEPADPQVVGALLAGQRPDGGWNPFWAPDYSGLDATCFRLAQADQLGLTGAEPAVGRALRFLAGRQRDDGSWEEAEAVRGLAPPWAAPGDPAARLYLTANCGFWLATLGDTSGGGARAARFLHGQLAPDGSLPTFAHAHWLAAGLWFRLGDREPAGRVLRYLGGQLGPDFPTSDLGWLLTTLHAAGVPPDHALMAQAAALLAWRQEADGRWPSEDGPSRDVHVTLEALRAQRLGGRPMREP